MTTIIASDYGVFTDSLATVNDSPLNVAGSFVRKAVVGENRDYVLAWAGSPEVLSEVHWAVDKDIKHLSSAHFFNFYDSSVKKLLEENQSDSGVLMLAPDEDGNCPLFYIGPNGAIKVNNISCPIFLGSGAEFAKGGFYALNSSTSLPFGEKVKRAMRIAAALDYYTGGPYILSYKWFPDEGFMEAKIPME